MTPLASPAGGTAAGAAPSTNPPAEHGGVLVGMALMEMSPAGVILSVSDSYCALLGRTREDLIGLSPLQFTHPDDWPASIGSLATLGTVPDSGRTIVEKRYLGRDDTVVWVRITAAWTDDRQRLHSHVADISDLVAARDAAAAARDAALAAERRLQALVEHSADLIALFDAEGRLTDANPATTRLVGSRVGQPVGAILAELTHPQDANRTGHWASQIYVRPGLQPPITFRIADQGGSWTHLEAIANNQLADPAIGGVIVIARDVSHDARYLHQVEGHKGALVGALARATEFRDPYTAGHQLKVADLSAAIAAHLGLPASEIADIVMGASLHDIGKIAIPAEILTRPGRLSPLEFEMVKTHSRVGYEILTDVDLPPMVTDIVLHHHERLDGSGYPDGLAGDQIALAVHIVGVADVLDAVSSHRPYRPSLGMAAGRQVIREASGRLFHPAVTAAALAVTSSVATSPAGSADGQAVVAESR